MNEKKGNKGLVWVTVILAIIVIGLVGYLVYDKVLSNNTSTTNNDGTISTPVKKLTEKDVETYLSYVPVASSSFGKDAYSENEVNVNTIDKKAVLFGLLHNKTLGNSSECVTEESFNKNLEKSYNLKIDNFSRQTKDSEVWYEDYLVLKDGKYCELGHGAPKQKSNMSVVSYQINNTNNVLTIKEQVGFVYGDADSAIVQNGSETVKTFECTTGVEAANNCLELAEDYVKNNINDFNTYKHTFNLHNDGTYYWYSTELLND